MITPGEWLSHGRGIFAEDGTHLALTTHPRDVEDHPDQKYPSYNDTIANARLMAASKWLMTACEASLLFHRTDRWDAKADQEWRALVGDIPPTSRGLCDFMRIAIGHAK